MNKSPSEIFNAAAGKVVAFKELRQKTNALYKQELSLGEKFFLYAVDKPASVVVGIYAGIRQVITGDKPEGAYISTSPFGVYATGGYLAAQMEKAAPYMPNKKFQEKINGMAARAFEQCEDHSQKPVMQTLKPVR